MWVTVTAAVRVTVTGLGLVGLRPHGVHPSRAMKVARASAGRPIRALWVIRLARGIKRPRNPF